MKKAIVLGCTGMVGGCVTQRLLDNGWDVTGVTDMAGVFAGCSALRKLDVSHWHIARVTSTAFAFDGCAALKELDFTGWDTSKAQTMDGMFQGCTSLVRVTTGDSFEMRGEGSFPDATAKNGKWYSTTDGAWYTSEAIISSRSARQDTYTTSSKRS